MSPVTRATTEAGRALAHSMIAGESHRRPVMDWITDIEVEARAMIVAEIRERLSWETPDEFGPAAEIRAALLDEVSAGPGEVTR